MPVSDEPTPRKFDFSKHLIAITPNKLTVYQSLVKRIANEGDAVFWSTADIVGIEATMLLLIMHLRISFENFGVNPQEIDSKVKDHFKKMKLLLD